MERLILNQLLDWKNSPYRKPLILKGVRQVGKTWVLKEFGRRYYENTAYFNNQGCRPHSAESNVGQWSEDCVGKDAHYL